jgi:hypothetical protein
VRKRDDGTSSIDSTTALNGDTIEATMIGREGVIGFPVITRRNGTARRLVVLW